MIEITVERFDSTDRIRGADPLNIFFYGLFMDESLLAEKGIRPLEVRLGFVEGYRLGIGQRATLVPGPDSRAYGAVMDVAPDNIAALYAEQSVADYLPVSVTVELMDGSHVDATCYLLPAGKLTGTNKDYARSLLDVATRLELPDSYLDEIKKLDA